MSVVRMRNISTTSQKIYQTIDGDVTITQYTPRLWRVAPRGKDCYMVASKGDALLAVQAEQMGGTGSGLSALVKKGRR